MNNDSIISDDQDVVETSNTFFLNAVDSLHISENRFFLTNTESLTDAVEIAIKRFESHPSIFDIKGNINNSKFNFSEVKVSDIELELKNLNSNKASTFENIPAKQLKQTSDICSESLMHSWNTEIIKNKIFPTSLKVADISPLFKKEV